MSSPEELDGVFVRTHPGTGGPEELPGEPVGHETGCQLVTLPRAAALARSPPHPELLAEVLAAHHELTAVLHLVAAQVGRGRGLPRAVDLRLQAGHQQAEEAQQENGGARAHLIINTFIWQTERDRVSERRGGN